MTILVTGGAGFIGSNFIHAFLRHNQELVLNLDALTYAGNMLSLQSFAKDSRLKTIRASIADGPVLSSLLPEYRPRAIFHFAAESHVDRSIKTPDIFVKTNIEGTFQLLHHTAGYWSNLSPLEKEDFRFIHISTDEVYGSLSDSDRPADETRAYAPNSPYAASKASSDHLVRAYHHTFSLPTITAHCSNNYGPYQFPEKLIPVMILRALKGETLPIYGDGKNIRDWLYVEDHCQALLSLWQKGRVGNVYNIGGNQEKTNNEIVMQICDILDLKKPKADGSSYRRQISYVPDRLGHDRRYALCADKLKNHTGWSPSEKLDTGLEKTIDWYLNHPDWVQSILTGDYQNWVRTHYGDQ
jgi:dTDP-glucose 4,6-dehydratase